jgi:hypothetical protein
MLQFDQKALQKEMNRVASAIDRAGARTVKAMSLNAKDRTLAQVRQFDKPTPYMLRSGAYQAGQPVVTSKGVVSTFAIAPDQSAVLQREISGGDRKPGEAGTTDTHMWVPATTDNPASVNRFGGVPKGYSRRLAAKAQKHIAKAAAGKKRKANANKPVIFEAALVINGRKTYAFWERKRATARQGKAAIDDKKGNKKLGNRAEIHLRP